MNHNALPPASPEPENLPQHLRGGEVELYRDGQPIPMPGPKDFDPSAPYGSPQNPIQGELVTPNLPDVYEGNGHDSYADREAYWQSRFNEANAKAAESERARRAAEQEARNAHWGAHQANYDKQQAEAAARDAVNRARREPFDDEQLRRQRAREDALGRAAVSPNEKDAANVMSNLAKQVAEVPPSFEGMLRHGAVRSFLGLGKPMNAEDYNKLSPTQKEAYDKQDEFAWEATKELIRQGIITTGNVETDDLLLEASLHSRIGNQYRGMDGTSFRFPRRETEAQAHSRQERRMPSLRPYEGTRYAAQNHDPVRIQRNIAFEVGARRPSDEFLDAFNQPFDTGTMPRTNGYIVNERGAGNKMYHTGVRPRHDGEDIVEEKPEEGPTMENVLVSANTRAQAELVKRVPGSRIGWTRTRRALTGAVGADPLERHSKETASELQELWGEDYLKALDDGARDAGSYEKYAEKLVDSMPHLGRSGDQQGNREWVYKTLLGAFGELQKRGARRGNRSSRS